MDKRTYFIAIGYKSPLNGISFANSVIHKSPIEWLKEERKKNSSATLLWWKQLTEEEEKAAIAIGETCIS
ncbi:MAG: hypothetical protein PHY05_03495 [Methanothrix sp.]|nr:hypothetical protein [Methanothrix sp.]